MTRVVVERAIEAPAEDVFRYVTDIERLPDNNPDVVSVEFLTDSRTGVGTRFRETRRMGNREMVSEIEVTEYQANERARMVNDMNGTVWDTEFMVTPIDVGTLFRITMDARPYKLVPRIMVPIMKGFFAKGIEKYADDVRSGCEAAAR